MMNHAKRSVVNNLDEMTYTDMQEMAECIASQIAGIENVQDHQIADALLKYAENEIEADVAEKAKKRTTE